MFSRMPAESEGPAALRTQLNEAHTSARHNLDAHHATGVLARGKRDGAVQSL
jgi:hypothetical protein